MNDPRNPPWINYLIDECISNRYFYQVLSNDVITIKVNKKNITIGISPNDPTKIIVRSSRDFVNYFHCLSDVYSYLKLFNKKENKNE